MHVVGPAPQVVNLQVDQTRLNGLAGQGLSQWVQAGRENRDDVNPHTRSSSPSGGSISTTPSASDTDVTIALTNGTKGFTRFTPHRQQLPGGGVQHLRDDADVLPRRRPDPKALELMVVVGVRLVDRRQIAGVHDEQGAPQLLGGVAVVDSGQSHQQPPTVLARALDDVAALLRRREVPWRAG